MEIKLNQMYSFHQVGCRDYQEDSRYPDADVPAQEQRFFVVCDGVGGCEKGEVASRIVCETFGKALKNVDFRKDFTNSQFSHILDAAYNTLDARSNDSNREMATTLAFICFHGGGCTMAHIGDSRIYQIRPSEGVVYRSDDHSMVNAMVHSGALTPEQAITHPQSNVITRYMEPVSSDENRSMAAVMRTVDVESGDYFFLCSDGVLHCVSDDELVEILLSDLDDEDKMLKIAALSQNSEDNNTAFLIPVVDVFTDLDTAERTELDYDDSNSHATKKIKIASQELEDIESIQPSGLTKIWYKIKNLI